MTETAPDIKQHLQQSAAEGTLRLSQMDLGTPSASEAVPETKTDIQAPVPEEAFKDPLTQDSKSKTQGLVLPEESPTFLKETVKITPEDRNVFIDAVLTNSRFTLPFTLYGGRVRGLFRSRTLREHDAVVAMVRNRMLQTPDLPESEFYRYLRACVLAVQVQMLGSQEYPEPEEPLFRRDNNPVPWETSIDNWLALGDRNPALVVPLFSALQDFERKYWALIASANDPNFFEPADVV